MSLPILDSPKIVRDEDLVRFYHRTERLWTEQIADATELNGGTAFSNARLATVLGANGILDATIPPDFTAEKMVDEVDRHFASVGCRCGSWVINPSSDVQRSQMLVDYLLSLGCSPEDAAIMHLTRAASLPSGPTTSLRFIPARAGFRQARLLAEEWAAECNVPLMADAQLLHLDDPHWDAILVLDGTTPVATAGVLISGEIGRIDQVFVSRPFRRKDVGTQLLSSVLQICARSLLKHVMVGVREDNIAATALFRKLGFASVGTFRRYRFNQGLTGTAT